MEWNKTDLEIAEKFHKIFLSFSLSQQEQMQADISFLEEKDQTKDEFLATLAHELRNPLSPMENAISLIEEAIDPNDENLTSILNILKRQQNQLGVLVNDLLDVSQITRRRLTLKIKDVNLLDLLKGAIETANKLIKSKNQTLKLNFKEDSILIRGDYSRLLQALSNVINNASKYTDENGQILVNCHPNSENVVIEISDNGIGIEKSKLKGIFNMFSQVDANENTRGGLGIGLTLTKKIIDIHDGKIIVESEGLGKGSSFKITLPRSKRLKESSGIQSNSNAPWIKDKNILIVDDNEDIITTLTLILTKKGAKISSALNAEDCLDKFSQSKFDLAILDIGLPDISGYELCKELKVKSSYEHAVFIAQSGWGQKEDKRKSREAGFDLHLTKPVKAKDLIQEVEDFINSKS